MKERILAAYDPFVLPFVFGMTFVLAWCLFSLVKVLAQLNRADRRKFALSLITPTAIYKNLRDIFCDCLLHVKLWKRNKGNDFFGTGNDSLAIVFDKEHTLQEPFEAAPLPHAC